VRLLDIQHLQVKQVWGYRGLKSRASTEARIGIFKNVFLGSPLLAKGFEHRELEVGWAALTHHLWLVARMAEAEKERKEDQEKKSKRPNSKKTKIRRTGFALISAILSNFLRFPGKSESRGNISENIF
jgi:hypothetical protein